MEGGFTRIKENIDIENIADRDVAKKPVNTKMGFGCIGLECPSCRSLVEFFQNYCSTCGQKLDWNTEDNI